MKLASVLATATLVAGSLAAATPASAAALTTVCDGTADRVTIPGDLFVPPGRHCSLTDVDVTGATEVSYGASLLVTRGTLTGDVLVRNDATFDVVEARVEGHVTNRGFGVFAEAAHFGGDMTTRAVSSTVPITQLLDTHLVGGLDSRGADALLDGSEVGGTVGIVGGTFADAYDSALLGALTVSGTGDAVVCESEVHGDAAFSGVGHGLQLGTTGALADCLGPTVWLGNLAVDDSTGGVEVSGNVVLGDLSGEGNDPAPVGADNRVRGDVTGQFLDLAPAPPVEPTEPMVGAQPPSLTAQTDAGTPATVARRDRLAAQVELRRAATVAAATAAGPIA